MGRLRRRIVDFLTRELTKPHGTYQRTAPNDLENLRRTIKKGDVLLVEGDQRVSEVIKYLTQSSWSHSAIYIGDELLRRYPELREPILRQFGEEARYLIVEALVHEGVTASPLSKYIDFNIRICRPYNLRRDDLQQILDDVIVQIGDRYDIKNLVDLARYFLPVTLVPGRLRRSALQFASGLPTQVICSSLIARAFHKVGYPIIPTITEQAEAVAEGRTSWRQRLRISGRRKRRAWLFRKRPVRLITPRDFDLSPYFEVVKFNCLAGAGFDYKKIRWAD